MKKKTTGKNSKNKIRLDNKYLQYTWRVVSSAVIILLIIIAFGIMLSYVKNPFGINAFSVLSNSMKPEISKGSLIFTKEQNRYSTGDIITYRPSSGRLGGVEVDTVTHRVIEELEISGKTYYRTQGDANPGPDVDPAEKENVVGKVVAEIPLIGFPIEFSKTERGFFILIVIPALFIIYNEIKSIKNELGKNKDDEQKRKRIKSVIRPMQNLLIKVQSTFN